MEKVKIKFELDKEILMKLGALEKKTGKSKDQIIEEILKEFYGQNLHKE